MHILFTLKLRNIDIFWSFYGLWSKNTQKAHKIMFDFENFYIFQNDAFWLGKYTYFNKKCVKLIMNKKHWFFVCLLCAYTIYLKYIIYNVERIFFINLYMICTHMAQNIHIFLNISNISKNVPACVSILYFVVSKIIFFITSKYIQIFCKLRFLCFKIFLEIFKILF